MEKKSTARESSFLRDLKYGDKCSELKAFYLGDTSLNENDQSIKKKKKQNALKTMPYKDRYTFDSQKQKFEISS